MAVTTTADNTSMFVTCKTCGTEFEITGEEQLWFIQHSLTLPCRCKECRKIRKKARKEMAAEIKKRVAEKELANG